MDKIYYAKPEDLNIPQVADAIGEKPYVVASVIQQIVEKQARKQTRFLEQSWIRNWWVELSSRKLKQIHHRAHKTVRELVDEDVLRCDESYVRSGSCVQGAKCKSFKFGRKIFDGSLDFFRLELSSIHHHAQTSLRSKKAGNIFDAPEELRELAEHVFNFKFALNEQSDPDLSKLDDIQKPGFSHLLNGQRHFKKAGFAGRVYTSFTAIPKEYRGQVSFPDTSDLVEIDLSMSQPFLFAGILQKNGLVVDDGCGSSVLKGREHYTEVVTGQADMDIYEHAQEVLQEEYSIEVTREMAKPKVLMLFNATEDQIKSDTYKAPRQREVKNKLKGLAEGFREKFPGVMERLNKLRKSVRMEHDTSPGDWMNQFEAEVMVHRVAKNLDDMPVLTLHDCVVVPEDRKEETRNLINEHFHDLFGLTPHLTVERLDSEATDPGEG